MTYAELFAAVAALMAARDLVGHIEQVVADLCELAESAE
jgi:biopolymer transport protein ExbB/TolQ